MKETELIKNMYSDDPNHIHKRLSNNIKVLERWMKDKSLRLQHYDSGDWVDTITGNHPLLRIEEIRYRPYGVKDYYEYEDIDEIKDRAGDTVAIEAFRYVKEKDILFFELEASDRDLTDYYVSAKELLKNYTQLDGSPLGVQI